MSVQEYVYMSAREGQKCRIQEVELYAVVNWLSWNLLCPGLHSKPGCLDLTL